MDRDMVVVLAVGLIARVWHVLETHSALVARLPVGDGLVYDAWARAISSGQWLGTGVFYQAPLYPCFLGLVYALLDTSLLRARIVQAVIGSLAAMLLVPTGRILLDRRSAFVGGLLLAIYPPMIFYDGLIQKTVLDVSLTALFLFAAARVEELSSRESVDHRRLDARLVGLGAALGLLSVSRENAIALGILVLPWLALRSSPSPRRYVARVFWFAFGLSLVLVPVGVRNLVRGGEFALTTSQLGTNFYLGNNPYTDGRYVPLREGRGDARFEREDATRIAEAESGRTLRPSEVSRFWLAKSFTWITEHPGDWLVLCGKKLLLSLNALEASDTESIEAYRDASTWLRTTGSLLHFGILAPLAVAGAWLTRRNWRRAVVLHGTIVVLFAGLVLFFVFGRYRAPALPALCLLAGAALTAIGRPLAARASRPSLSRADLIGALLLVGGTAVLANLPRSEGPAQHALGYHAVGSALLDAGRTAEAGAAFERALALRPGQAATLEKLAVVRYRQSRLDEAANLFRSALELDPDDGDVRGDYGRLLFEQGRFAEAAAEYEAAHALRPNDPNLACDLGAALIELGRFAEAVTPLEAALKVQPDHAIASANLGQALFRLHRLAEASVHADRSAQLAPGNALNQLLAGRIHEALGNTPAARAYYERAVQADPQNTEARARWSEFILRTTAAP